MAPPQSRRRCGRAAATAALAVAALLLAPAAVMAQPAAAPAKPAAPAPVAPAAKPPAAAPATAAFAPAAAPATKEQEEADTAAGWAWMGASAADIAADADAEPAADPDAEPAVPFAAAAVEEELPAFGGAAVMEEEAPSVVVDPRFAAPGVITTTTKAAVAVPLEEEAVTEEYEVPAEEEFEPVAAAAIPSFAEEEEEAADPMAVPAAAAAAAATVGTPAAVAGTATTTSSSGAPRVPAPPPAFDPAMLTPAGAPSSTSSSSPPSLPVGRPMTLVPAGPAGQDGGSSAADFLAAAGSPSAAAGEGLCACAQGSVTSKPCADAIAKRCSTATPAFRDADPICSTAGYPGASIVLKGNSTAAAALAEALADACYPDLGAWGPVPIVPNTAKVRAPTPLELGSDPCACFQSGLGSRDCTFARLSLCRAKSLMCPALLLGDAASVQSQRLAEAYAAQYCTMGVPAMAEMIAVGPGLTAEKMQALFSPMLAEGLAQAAGVDQRQVRLAFHTGVVTGAAPAAAAGAAAGAAAPAPANTGGWGVAAPAAAAAPAAKAAAAAAPAPKPATAAAVGWGAAAPAAAPAPAPAATSPLRRMLLQAVPAPAPAATQEYTSAVPPVLVSARIAGPGAADALRKAATTDGGKAFYDALAAAGFGYKPSLKLGDDATPVLKGEPRYTRATEESDVLMPAKNGAAAGGVSGAPPLPWWKSLLIALGVIFGVLAILGGLFACCMCSKMRNSRKIRERHEAALAQSLRANGSANGSSGSASPPPSPAGSDKAAPVAVAASQGKHARRYSDDASFARDQAAVATTAINPLNNGAVAAVASAAENKA
jgi:hypothetical protein